VAGWLKRGPTGVIGTNKSDAAETVRSLLADLAGGPGPDDTPVPRAGMLRYPEPQPDATPESQLEAVLTERGIQPVSYSDWLRVEAAEMELAKSLGRGTRVKLHSRDALWAACRPKVT
jgi:ferredoxin--NADP+ reductase